MSWGSELWCGSLPGARDGDAGLHSHAGGRAARDQPVLEFVLPEAATRQPRGPAVRRTDRGGLRRKTRVRISPGGLVAATKGKSSSESKTRIAGDARTWVAGALAASARTTEERVGTRGSSRGESNLGVGYVHFFALLGDAGAARHHPSTDGVSSPGRQQLHQTVPSQLERGGSLNGGVSELGRSASIDRSLDRGVQSRPTAPRSRKPHSARGFLGFCSCTKKGERGCSPMRSSAANDLAAKNRDTTQPYFR